VSDAPPRPDSQLSAIARGGALNLAGGVVAGVSGFAVTAVITNGWDQSTAGVLFSGTSLFLILSATALLGTDTGLARFVLRYEALGRAADVAALLRIALRPVLAASAALALILGVFADEISRWTRLPDGGADVLRLLAVALPLATVAEACLAATRAYGSMRASVLVDKLLRCGGQPLTVAAAGLLGAGAAGLAGAWSQPYAAAALLAPVVLVRLIRTRRAPDGDAPPRPVCEIRREFWRYTWLRGLARIFQVALQRVDIVMVAAMRSPAEAALYTAATRFVVVGQLGVQAVQQVLQPHLARLLATGDRAGLTTVFTTSTAWSIASSWPVYVTAIVAAPTYLGVFGDRYVSDGQLIVVVMGLGMLLSVAAGPVDVLLLMSGRSAASLGNNALALAANVILNLVLIPRYGAEGAAVSWALALVVRNVLPFVQVRHCVGVTGIGRAGAIAVAASLFCFGAPMLALRLAVGPGPAPAVALMTISSAVYLVVLHRLRGPLRLDVIRRRRADHDRAGSAALEPGSRS
jgi:O-antigen/teichoic acid export membrane protein